MPALDLTPLVQLGLTQLEAEIYAFLLEHSPATGYGVAKGISKPTANTYKALESLHRKGAIIIDDSDTRLCRAIPTEELLDLFQRQFETARGQAQSEFRKLKAVPGDRRVYQLKTPDQVFQRFRRMLSRCRRVAVLDLFPVAVEQLEDEMARLAKRGAKVTLKAYRPCKISGVEIILASEGEQTVQNWPGLWVNGVCDAEEYLLAFLSRDGRQVYQAVWSNNQYLSWIYYGGFVNELMADELRNGFDRGLDREALKRIIKKYDRRLRLEAAGYKNAASFFVGRPGTKSGKGKKS